MLRPHGGNEGAENLRGGAVAAGRHLFGEEPGEMVAKGDGGILGHVPALAVGAQSCHILVTPGKRGFAQAHIPPQSGPDACVDRNRRACAASAERSP